ncbi:MAG: hypothetical protein ABUK08_00235 [Candidatus Humimicrobiaceae bacterium]
MRFDNKTNKQKATDLKISKLSVCATPAHEGALATIIKEAAVTEEDRLNNNTEGETEMTEEQIAKMIADAVALVEKKLEKAETLAKMNDLTKAHYHSLNDGDKETFLKSTDKERETIMWTAGIKKEEVVKKVEDDETFTSNGTTIQKSVVGEGVFNLMKSQQNQIEKANEATAIEKEKRELQDFIKQAELQYPNLPGEVENKGMVMKSISTMPTEARETLSTMLKAGNEAMDSANLFKEVGSDGIPFDDGSPLSKLNKMAEEKAKTDGTTEAVAYSSLLNTPEGNVLYQQSLKS